MTHERASKATQAAYDLCKFIENGDKPANKAYQKTGDIVTIGWGYTGKILDTLTGQLRPLRLGDVITDEEADRLFDQVAAPEAERRVDFFFPSLALTQGQRDALFLFCYNLRWKSIADSTLRTLLNSGDWTRETVIQWWIKYRNPKTQFEEGLYRRRIAELCIFFDCDPEVAEKASWEAELRRDPSTKEIIRQTDPELIILRAETRTEAKKIAEEEIRLAASPASRPAEADPVPVSPGTTVEPKPVAATKPAAIKVEGLPEIGAPKPVAKPKPRPTAGQPAGTSPEDDIRRNPQFWSMLILIFGRIGVAAGFVPAMFTDVINDKNFQVALAGVISIYVAMFIAHQQQKQRDKAEAAALEAYEAEQLEAEKGEENGLG
jgi:GH24 family phage-related lysozyme (muramidase)